MVLNMSDNCQLQIIKALPQKIKPDSDYNSKKNKKERKKGKEEGKGDKEKLFKSGN